MLQYFLNLLAIIRKRYLSSSLVFVLKSVLSNSNVTTPPVFWLLFPWGWEWGVCTRVCVCQGLCGGVCPSLFPIFFSFSVEFKVCLLLAAHGRILCFFVQSDKSLPFHWAVQTFTLNYGLHWIYICHLLYVYLMGFLSASLLPFELSVF